MQAQAHTQTITYIHTYIHPDLLYRVCLYVLTYSPAYRVYVSMYCPTRAAETTCAYSSYCTVRSGTHTCRDNII